MFLTLKSNKWKVCVEGGRTSVHLSSSVYALYYTLFKKA